MNIRKIAIYLLSLLMVIGVFGLAGTANAAAQNRDRKVRVIYRPVYVYRPFWWYDRYYYDPFYRDSFSPERRYSYLLNQLRKEEEDLAEDQEAIHADGVVTLDEQRELDKDYRQLADAREDLDNFLRVYGNRWSG